MREYKLRVWDKYNTRNKMMYSETELFDDMIGFRFEHFDGDLKDLKIMQWTGIKDKNGKDIYEGDIVSISASQPGEEGYEGSGIVTFMEGSWVVDTGFEIIFLWSETLIAEVKSNIFEYSPKEENNG